MVKTITTDLVKMILASGSTEDTINTLNDRGLLESYKHEPSKGAWQSLCNSYRERRDKGVLLNCNIYHDSFLPSTIKFGNIIASGFYGYLKFGPFGLIEAPITGIAQRVVIDKLSSKIIDNAYTKNEGKTYESKIKDAVKLLKTDSSIESSLEEPVNPNFARFLVPESHCVQGLKSLAYICTHLGLIMCNATPIAEPTLIEKTISHLMEIKTYSELGALMPTMIRMFKGLKDMPETQSLKA